MKIDTGFEFYWPKQNLPVVNLVERIFTGVEKQYGQTVQIEKVTFVDDYGKKETWKLDELKDSIDKGFIVPYERDVPHKARKRIISEAIPSFIRPEKMFTLLVQGRKVNVGVTSYTDEMTSLVDDDGRLIRKKSIIDETLEYMTSRGFARK